MGRRAVALRLPSPCLVVLVGTSGAGKSTWANARFAANEVVSSDRLRGMVGIDEFDQHAGTDTFAVLDLIVDRRLRRGLVTVIDSLALITKRRRAYIALARKHGVPVHTVVFDTPPDVCRARIRQRGRPVVPAKVFNAQVAELAEVRRLIVDEGFDGIHTAGTDDAVDVAMVAPDLLDAPAAAARQRKDPITMRFGLQVPNFTWEGGAAELRDRLAAVGRAADAAGFESLWVMDHFLQIPQVGREWQEMLDSYTDARVPGRRDREGQARRARHRHHLPERRPPRQDRGDARRAVRRPGDLRSRRRVVRARARRVRLGVPAPRPAVRQARGRAATAAPDVGQGLARFDGATTTVAEAMCYPRPLQEHVPLLVGGGGEKRTLRLVAQYADACNLFGDGATVRHKVDVLHAHSADVDRDPAAITVTHLSTALVADRSEGRAATVEDLIGRYRQLAEAGVDTAIVNMPDLDGGDPVKRFAPVIEAFS